MQRPQHAHGGLACHALYHIFVVKRLEHSVLIVCLSQLLSVNSPDEF